MPTQLQLPQKEIACLSKQKIKKSELRKNISRYIENSFKFRQLYLEDFDLFTIIPELCKSFLSLIFTY